MTILEVLSCGCRIYIAEDLAGHAVIGMGMESELSCVSNSAFDQLSEAGRIYGSQSLGCRTVGPVSLIFSFGPDRKKSILDAQAERVQQEYMAMCPSGNARLKTKFPNPCSNKLSGIKHSWIGA